MRIGDIIHNDRAHLSKEKEGLYCVLIKSEKKVEYLTKSGFSGNPSQEAKNWYIPNNDSVVLLNINDYDENTMTMLLNMLRSDKDSMYYAFEVLKNKKF